MYRLILMRVLQIVILVVVFGWLFSPSQISGSYAMSQAPKDSTSIIAPNVFTPNGDGVNDVFEVRSTEESNVVSLEIYTRAGVLVFSIEAKRCRWDGNSLTGQPLANGVYYYTAEIIKETSDTSSKNSKCGFFHLYR